MKASVSCIRNENVHMKTVLASLCGYFDNNHAYYSFKQDTRRSNKSPVIKPKFILLLLWALLFSPHLFSQVYKNRARDFAYKYKDDLHGAWSKWSYWTQGNILVVIDLDKQTFTIYTKETQRFDIVKNYRKEYDDKGVEVFRMSCVDKNGLKCDIRERFVSNRAYFAQLYVDYDDLSYVYNLVHDK